MPATNTPWLDNVHTGNQQQISLLHGMQALVLALVRLSAPRQPASFVTGVSTMEHGEPVARLFV